MTESTKPPKPLGLEVDALHDAAWDLRDYHEAFIHDETDAEKWLYWLRRYEGFGEDEIQVTILSNVLHITYKE
jgi:hypothetical protein